MNKYIKAYCEIFLDNIYSLYLCFKQRDKLTERDMEKIKNIERSAYSSADMCIYSECQCKKDFFAKWGCFRESQLKMMMNDSWYLIKLVEKKKKISILKDEPYIRDSEMYHELIIIDYKSNI